MWVKFSTLGINKCKIGIMFLPIILIIYVWDALNNRLIATVLLSTNDLCFGSEIKKQVWNNFIKVIVYL